MNDDLEAIWTCSYPHCARYYGGCGGCGLKRKGKKRRTSNPGRSTAAVAPPAEADQAVTPYRAPQKGK